MKVNVLSLALATQLVAVGAFAQTSDTTTGTTGAGSASGTYGNDWPQTLGTAMFDGTGTTVRSDSEVAAQWMTLSEEDKALIRRDCMALQQQSGVAGGDSAASDSATAPAATGGSGATSDVTGTTTGTTDPAAGTTGATTGTSTDTAGTGSSAASDGSTAPISVSAEQLEQICTLTEGM